jgi:tRNA nucleotidyltransferase/poly(A) polymerase
MVQWLYSIDSLIRAIRIFIGSGCAAMTYRVSDPFVGRIVDFFRRRGVAAWLVGGAVRDYFLGRPNHDLDLVTPASGIQLARGVANAFGGSFFVLDADRDVGRAILREPGEDEPLFVDVARFRPEVLATGGPGASDLLSDLAYRDFTANAMAVDVLAAPDAKGSLPVIDPFDGRGAVARRQLCAVSDHVFHDDPLRMLRAVRQSAELDFRITEGTFNLIRRDAALLPATAVERVRDELWRIVVAPSAWRHMRLLWELGLLPYTLPEVAALSGVRQSAPHYADVFDHTRAVVAHLEGLMALLWPTSGYHRPLAVTGDPVRMAPAERWAEVAALLAPYADALRAHLAQPLASGHTRRDWMFWGALAHDWGKAGTASLEETPHGARIHFYGHEDVSARLVEARARSLAFAAVETSYLRRVVGEHMRPGLLAADYPPSRRALYRLFRDAGDVSPDVALLSLADRLGMLAPQQAAPQQAVEMSAHLQSVWWASWQHHLDVVATILRNYFAPAEAGAPGGPEALQVDARPRPLLDGHQIMAELGLPPSREIGRLLEGLREAQAVGEVTTVDEARAWLQDNLHI